MPTLDTDRTDRLAALAVVVSGWATVAAHLATQVPLQPAAVAAAEQFQTTAGQLVDQIQRLHHQIDTNTPDQHA